MFCPACRYEYTDGIRTCPDCGETLVDKLPIEEDSKIDFIPLPSLPGRVYGDMVKGALEEKGIPCYIRSENIGDAYQAQGTFPFGGVRIFIPENRLQEALSIQQQMMDQNE